MDRNNLKGLAYKVLDSGFLQLVDFMGDDADICQAARVSYGKGTKSISDDKNLIRYLFRHRHTTPFEMVECKFRIKIPMDAWRQMIRTRTANVNEYSTRYSEAIDDMACTNPKEWRLQSGSNKQGSGGFIDEETGKALSVMEARFHGEAKHLYQERLRSGMAREQARKDLPLSNYTMAYWKIDLHNLFHFLKLRCDSHAQLEIREYANILAGFVKELYPVAFEAWYDYSYQAVNFTRLDRELLQFYHKLIVTPVSSDHPMMEQKANEIGMSKRELEEFWTKLTVPSYQDFTLPADRLLESI